MKNLILLASIVAVASAKTVKLNFWKNKAPASSHRANLVRRNDEFANPLTGDGQRIEYFINVTIGTPPQPFALQLDTGSSDTWVPSADSYSCEDDGCIDYGAFNKNVSSTYKLLPGQEGTFDITYADLSYALGDYFTDVLSFGGNISLPGTTMAVANDTDEIQGLMGVGFRANLASLTNEEPFDFPTVPEVLKNQGLIDRVAYSLYLDSYADNQGSILFGGIDSSRYTGELLALPLSPDSYTGNYTEFRIALTQISIHDGVSTRALSQPKFNAPALLDSGTTFSYLPQDITEAVTEGLGAVLSEDNGYYYLPCSYRKSNASLVYTFGGPKGVNISVPLSELISEQLDDESAYRDGTPACTLLIQAVDDSSGVILGDSFLRSAYAVYDLENLVVALAQAKVDNLPAINDGDDSVKAIPSGTALPGVTRTATVTAEPIPTDAAYSVYLGVEGTPTFSLPGITAAATGQTQAQAQSQGNGASGMEMANAFGAVVMISVIVFQLFS